MQNQTQDTGISWKTLTWQKVKEELVFNFGAICLIGVTSQQELDWDSSGAECLNRPIIEDATNNSITHTPAVPGFENFQLETSSELFLLNKNNTNPNLAEHSNTVATTANAVTHPPVAAATAKIM
jgi:hypothetical protein